MEIKNQEFKKVMRGYDPVEVNTFMEMLSNEIENNVKEQKDSRERVIELEAQLKEYKQIEKSLQQALLQAQESATRAREQSQQEADILIRQAETKAAEILRDARNTLAMLTTEVERLKTIRETMVSRFKILLNSQIDLLRSLEAESEADRYDERKVAVGKKSLKVDDILDKLDQLK
jgi:cell division initiation protein